MGEVRVELGDDFVATVEMCRPPNNFFDAAVIRELADAYEELDAGRPLPGHRAVLARGSTSAPAPSSDRRGHRARGRSTCTARGAPVRGRAPGGGRGTGGRRSAADSGSRCRPTSGWRAREAGSPPTSPGSASTTASASASRCRRSWASRRRPSSCSTPASGSTATTAQAIGLVDRLVEGRRGPRRGPRAGRRAGRVGAAGGARHPGDVARRAGGKGASGHGPRATRAGPAQRHHRLPGGSAGLGRAEGAPLHRVMTRRRPPRVRGSVRGACRGRRRSGT